MHCNLHLNTGPYFLGIFAAVSCFSYSFDAHFGGTFFAGLGALFGIMNDSKFLCIFVF